MPGHQTVALALRVAVLVEKAPTTKALHHPVARTLQPLTGPYCPMLLA